MDAVIGVDIGTSSSKGVLVGLDGVILATAVREHEVSRPVAGHVEMSMTEWWDEFVAITRELRQNEATVVAVGVSGMGPCVGLADEAGTPLRPAILYGVDTRAHVQIAELTERLGAEAVEEVCGSALSTQAVGPKLAWLAEHEPEVFGAARRLFMPSSYLAWKLTGAYVLDHQSASQSVPLYDIRAREWYRPWADDLVGEIELPELVWADTVIGGVSAEAAEATGLPAGIPVIAGTIDAWSEAISVDGHNPGDLMLMYGTTMFLINTLSARASAPELWSTVGAFEDSYNLAGGMATSGAITGWLRKLVGNVDYPTLLGEAAQSPAGANGLLLLPYFAGERTPIADPFARGVIAGLTLEHSRGDLYRAVLEATAMGVRHHVEAFRAAAGQVDRVVAVGGGTQSELWLQIVSDVTGLEQVVPRVTVGASFGAAYLAASAVAEVSIGEWNPPARRVQPDASTAAGYDALFELYRRLYVDSASVVHALAGRAD